MPSSRLALAAALAAFAVAVPAAAKKPDPAPAAGPAAPDAKNISAKVRPLLGAAQKAQAAGDLPGALTQLQAAEAVGNLNSTDVFYVEQIKLGIAIQQKDDALIETTLKALVNNEFVSPAERPKYLRNLASFALKRNDYATATTYFEQMTAGPNASAQDLSTLAELYTQQKQNAQAIATLQKAIAASQAAGQTADENWYRRELKIAFDAKMTPQVQTASMDLVQAYPSPTNWRDVLLLYRDGNKLDDQGILDTYRLMDTAQALNGERDYAEYIETAIGKGLPGEAKTVLAEGIAKGMLSNGKPYVAEYNKSITTHLAADKAGLAAADKDARAAANGRTALGQGDAYFSYGDYAKAAEMYRLALSKGGIDAPTANLRLGVSLAKAGDKAGANTAFAAVDSGPRVGLAKYWTVWLTQKA